MSAGMSGDVLSKRVLNRATLERQLLLRRSAMPALDAVRHLVGVQAQVPLNPYLGLWSRIDRFQPEQLAQLVLDRQVVRIVVMRATLHLVTADDCLVLRPLMQPVLDRELLRHRDYGPSLRAVDLAPVLAFAQRLLAERPRTGAELRRAMDERFPDLDAGALAYACRNVLPLVQVPPRGVWGHTGAVASTTAEAYLGRALATDPSIDSVVLRYFAAFGPASVADVAAWSGLTGMREVVDRLETRLRPFRDEGGRELFDLPDAPRLDPDTPAPPRFLPEYDNLLLAHADLTRFISEDHRKRLFASTRPVRGSVLYDGSVCGTWRLDADQDAGSVRLVIDAVARLTKRGAATLAASGRRLLRFLASDAETHDVHVVALD
jgi:hypothetical protein